MVSAGILIIWMQRSGLVNLHRCPLPIQDQLQTLYNSFQISIFLLYLLIHLYSTLTRATRYQPELIQTLLEDKINLFVLYTVCFYRVMYVELKSLVDFVEISFSKAYQDINKFCARESRKLFICFFAFVLVAILGSFVETALPLVPRELAVRQEIYRTQHPERRLPYSVRIPFIDETQSYVYEIVYGFITYVMSFYCAWVCLSVSLAPIMLIHLRGQYMILSRFLEQVGHPHRDSQGHRIYYTSIEWNEYVIKMYREAASQSSVNAQLQMERQYERQFIRQIFVYHQKLLTFQEEVIALFSPLVFGLLIANNIIISLSLYQIVASPTKLTPLRYFKFAAELFAALVEYSILCNCSYVTAECHEILRTAFGNSQWHLCFRETRKDLVMLLRRTTWENNLRFFNGAVILNRAYIIKVLRVAYTFVNYMRLREARSRMLR